MLQDIECSVWRRMKCMLQDEMYAAGYRVQCVAQVVLAAGYRVQCVAQDEVYAAGRRTKTRAEECDRE
jgi:hypothetical protein